MSKFIFVTGGVVSSLGKGIAASSIGCLLESRGLKVNLKKFDPYLNVDPGTMSPFQHGEVFVTDDGAETDLDLGHYERFTHAPLSQNNNLTSGRVYERIITRERRGDYLGKTVQVIPHVTNEIKAEARKFSDQVDVTIIEIGGTVGDIESMPFLEAVRQMNTELGKGENCMFVHTTLVPVLGTVGEQKTKPTQHSVKELRAIGIQPDVIVARAKEPLEYSIKRKISLFCDVPLEAVVSAPDARSIYEVPLILEEQGLTEFIIKHLKLPDAGQDLMEWKAFLSKVVNPTRTVRIACVGKYTHLADSYISHLEAFHHAGAELETKVEMAFIDSEVIQEKGIIPDLAQADGILIPGGFGSRGIEGKIMACRHARENKVPFLGVCLGFQMATIELSRHLLDMEGANTTEIDPETKFPVIDLLPEQRDVKKKGASMRLGAQPVVVAEGSRAYELYGNKNLVMERHRHRYEVNPKYIEDLEKAGWRFSGKAPDGVKMEIGELDGHPYYMASQFHPEFKSRPGKPSPLHFGLVRAALQRKYQS